MSASQGQKRHISGASKRVERFIRSSERFQYACEQAFRKVDLRGVGKVDTATAALACAYFFQELGTALQEYGILVEQPSPNEVQQLLVDSGYGEHDTLDRQQFEELYVTILKHAVVRCTAGFAQRYGIGILTATASVMVVKRVIRAIPVVGTVSSPFLALLPSLLVGPALGIAGVYTIVQGDPLAVPKKLFRKDQRGQFRTG